MPRTTKKRWANRAGAMVMAAGFAAVAGPARAGWVGTVRGIVGYTACRYTLPLPRAANGMVQPLGVQHMATAQQGYKVGSMVWVCYMGQWLHGRLALVRGVCVLVRCNGRLLPAYLGNGTVRMA